MGGIDENSSVLCTSATIASTRWRFLGRGVSDAAALSFRVRGLLGVFALVVGEVLVEGLRAGSPLSIRFLTVGALATFAVVAALVAFAAALAAKSDCTCAATGGVHTAAPVSLSAVEDALTAGVACSCWSDAILRVA